MEKIKGIVEWVKQDYQQYPTRFCLEVFAWVVSISCCITMALTVPNPPLIKIYPLWIMCCSIYAWAAYTRGSFGILANSLFVALIDAVGFIRILFYS